MDLPFYLGLVQTKVLGHDIELQWSRAATILNKAVSGSVGDAISQGAERSMTSRELREGTMKGFSQLSGVQSPNDGDGGTEEGSVEGSIGGECLWR